MISEKPPAPRSVRNVSLLRKPDNENRARRFVDLSRYEEGRARVS
jgi:hypothetical protein